MFCGLPFAMLDLKRRAGTQPKEFLRLSMRAKSVSGQPKKPVRRDDTKCLPPCQDDGRLVDILADMVRSALSWEAIHGRPLAPLGNTCPDRIPEGPLISDER